MSEKIFELSIPADDEGYIAFECPYCGIRFKLEAEEFKASSIIDLYCPACGLVNQINSFYTREVIEKAEEIAMNYAIDMINKMFKDLERSTRSINSGFKLTHSGFFKLSIIMLVTIQSSL